ncbi:protein of unknown function (plasmid) [Cupriavidus taiwanensis]|nr:hypothetical protein CBM2622_B110102 [Cupriavidus taiwanensis]SPD56760.1 protein of unknown function [Cupriavidus taiwanensis]
MERSCVSTAHHGRCQKGCGANHGLAPRVIPKPSDCRYAVRPGHRLNGTIHASEPTPGLHRRRRARQHPRRCARPRRVGAGTHQEHPPARGRAARAAADPHHPRRGAVALWRGLPAARTPDRHRGTQGQRRDEPDARRAQRRGARGRHRRPGAPAAAVGADALPRPASRCAGVHRQRGLPDPPRQPARGRDGHGGEPGAGRGHRARIHLRAALQQRFGGGGTPRASAAARAPAARAGGIGLGADRPAHAGPRRRHPRRLPRARPAAAARGGALRHLRHDPVAAAGPPPAVHAAAPAGAGAARRRRAGGAADRRQAAQSPRQPDLPRRFADDAGGRAVCHAAAARSPLPDPPGRQPAAPARLSARYRSARLAGTASTGTVLTSGLHLNFANRRGAAPALALRPLRRGAAGFSPIPARHLLA